MLKKTELKHIISLLDDKTPDVRDVIISELRDYGSSLEWDIHDEGIEIPVAGVEIISPILKEHRKKYILEHWSDWLTTESDHEKLVKAVKLLECFHHGLVYCNRFEVLVDDLENQFRRLYPDGNEIDLANFLFKIKGISGAKDDYYNSLNSSIIYAIQNNKGLPITLAVLYILLGYRMEFDIEGVNFPGHFLARTFIENEPVLIDGFNGGKILQKSDIAQLASKETIESIYRIIEQKTYAVTIVRRILNNLTNAFKARSDDENARFFNNLYNAT